MDWPFGTRFQGRTRRQKGIVWSSDTDAGKLFRPLAERRGPVTTRGRSEFTGGGLPHRYSKVSCRLVALSQPV